MGSNGKLTVRRAVKQRQKLRLAFIGPSNSGKTRSALHVARGLVGESGRIVVIDTENESSNLYADHEEFDSAPLNDHSPMAYVSAIKQMEAAGYDAIIIDSLSHAWMGKGGALEMVDNFAAKTKGGDKFGSWRHVTPKHNELVEALITSTAHILVTMRAKTEWILEEYVRDGQKKVKPVKVGLAPIQRDGLEYEFTITMDIGPDHVAAVSKTRWSEIDGEVIDRPGVEFGQRLRVWLDAGVQPQANAPQASPTSRPGHAGPPPASSAPAGASDSEPPPHDDADGPPEDAETPWEHARQAAAVKAAETELGAEVESVGQPRPRKFWPYMKSLGLRHEEVIADMKAQFGVEDFALLDADQRKQMVGLAEMRAAKNREAAVAVVRAAREGAR